MANPDHENANTIVLNVGNDAIVADAIFPKLAELRSLQRFSQRARIISLAEPIAQKFQYSLCGFAP